MSNLYTSEDIAVTELKQRQSDPELKVKVDTYLKGDIPEPLKQDGLYAILCRNIFTPDYEIEIFLEKANRLGLIPLLFEYTQDAFVDMNSDKHALGKLYFYLNTDKSGHVNLYGFRLIDFDNAKKKNIDKITTLWGENLVSYHHRVLEYFYPTLMPQIYDCSEWFHRNGMTAKEYYKAFFALFIRNAILFDNFRDHDVEAFFLTEVMQPALDTIAANFDSKPLICSIQNAEDENNPKWWGYSADKKDKMIELAKDFPLHGARQA